MVPFITKDAIQYTKTNNKSTKCPHVKPVIEQPQVVKLVRQTKIRLKVSQSNFVAKVGIGFQSVNGIENGQMKPLGLGLKQIQVLLHQMGDRGKDFLVKYFPE